MGRLDLRPKRNCAIQAGISALSRWPDRIEKKRTAFDGAGSSPADDARVAPIFPPAPDGLVFHGGALLTRYDPERGETPVERMNRVWSFSRR